MNCELVNTVDNKELQKEIKNIDDNILIMDSQIKEITMKLNEIQNFTTVFQKKSNLYNNEENIELKMQISLLQNEKEHITNMKKIFITNLFNELYELSNNIILLISSFLNLEFNENINSSEILKKLVRIKQLTTIRMIDIYESVSAICKNLNLVYDTLSEFNDYIESMGSSIKTNNYHCSNVYTSLKHKYSFIMLEYTKYYNTINNIIPFYYNLSVKVNAELNHKTVLFHCLNNNSSDIMELNTKELNLNHLEKKKNRRSSAIQKYLNANEKTIDLDNSPLGSVVSFDLSDNSSDNEAKIKLTKRRTRERGDIQNRLNNIKINIDNYNTIKEEKQKKITIHQVVLKNLKRQETYTKIDNSKIDSNNNSKIDSNNNSKIDSNINDSKLNNNQINNKDTIKQIKNKSDVGKSFRSVVNRVMNSKQKII